MKALKRLLTAGTLITGGLLFSAAANAFCVDNKSDWPMRPQAIPQIKGVVWDEVNRGETACFEDYEGLVLLYMYESWPPQIAQVKVVDGGMVLADNYAAKSLYPDGKLKEYNTFGRPSGRGMN